MKVTLNLSLIELAMLELAVESAMYRTQDTMESLQVMIDDGAASKDMLMCVDADDRKIGYYTTILKQLEIK